MKTHEAIKLVNWFDFPSETGIENSEDLAPASETAGTIEEFAILQFSLAAQAIYDRATESEEAGVKIRLSQLVEILEDAADRQVGETETRLRATAKLVRVALNDIWTLS